MLSNAYCLAKFRIDTAENEPAKNLQQFANFPILLTVTRIARALPSPAGAPPRCTCSAPRPRWGTPEVPGRHRRRLRAEELGLRGAPEAAGGGARGDQEGHRDHLRRGQPWSNTSRRTPRRSSRRSTVTSRHGILLRF